MNGWTVLIAAHATGATLALMLGAVVVLRRRKGDRAHRRMGRVWMVAMYWTVLSSFWIRKLHPGHFSWIHGLSVFTFITLTIALWAALTHRVETHKRFVVGSYCGLLGAFLGAVTVPVRLMPQLAFHRPLVLAAALAAVAGVTALIARQALAAVRRSGRQ